MLNGKYVIKKMYDVVVRDEIRDTFDQKIIDNFHRALKDRSMIFLRRTDHHMENIDATTFVYTFENYERSSIYCHLIGENRCLRESIERTRIMIVAIITR